MQELFVRGEGVLKVAPPLPPENFNHTPPLPKMVRMFPYNTHIKTLCNLNATWDCLDFLKRENMYDFHNKFY